MSKINYTIDQTAAELETALNVSVSEMNVLLKDKDAKAITRAEKDGEIVDMVKDLNTRTMEEAFETWASKPNPMLAALCDGYVKAYSIRKAFDAQTKVATYLVAEGERVVDLVKFEDVYAGKGTLSENGQWRFKAETFGRNLGRKIASEIKANPIGNDYAMSDKAKGVTFSNSSLLNQLNEIISDIIFLDDGNGGNEFKALSHDVKFALYSIPKRNRKARLSFTMGTAKVVREIVTEVTHRVVTGAKYDMDYKRITKKTSLKVMKSETNKNVNVEVKTA